MLIGQGTRRTLAVRKRVYRLIFVPIAFGGLRRRVCKHAKNGALKNEELRLHTVAIVNIFASLFHRARQRGDNSVAAEILRVGLRLAILDYLRINLQHK